MAKKKNGWGKKHRAVIVAGVGNGGAQEVCILVYCTDDGEQEEGETAIVAAAAGVNERSGYTGTGLLFLMNISICPKTPPMRCAADGITPGIWAAWTRTATWPLPAG